MKKKNGSKRFLHEIKWIFIDWEYYLGLFLSFLPGPAIITLSIVALKYAWLPTWLLSLTIVAGWCVFNCNCWSYEAWRASGPRGIFINTCGLTDDMPSNLVWLFFGFFIMIPNILLRVQLIYQNKNGYFTFIKPKV